MIWQTVLLTSCVKLLLIPSYHSTDFEVHRNWLAITHSLPISKWYTENTSEWTLDYPPLFAWFEYFLSHFAVLFDRNMLVVSNLNYKSAATVLFQRLSVIVSDLVFAYGTFQCSKSTAKGWRADVVLPMILLTNAGLLMVDHIHFQYNGLLFGVLLLSIAKTLQGNIIQSAFWFAILLNMKHIYLYMAPAYFVYFLRNYCFQQTNLKTKEFLMSFSFKKFIHLGTTVISIFFVTFAPFLNQLDQVLLRLFPFKRGLCHAYWAPNVWALYNVADKFFSMSANLVGIKGNDTVTASMTGGLVQEFSHGILPTITPMITVAISAFAMIPAMIKLWQIGKDSMGFMRCLVICALTSFLFGWHVHEKAILMAIIPMSILAVSESGDAKVFLFLTTVGHYSLFPLLFPKSLLLIKVLLLIIHSTYAFYSLSNLYPLQICKFTFPLLNLPESIYLLGLIPLFVYENVIHDLLPYGKQFPFVPLMLVSCYCSLGIVYSWCKYYLYFLNKRKKVEIKKRK